MHGETVFTMRWRSSACSADSIVFTSSIPRMVEGDERARRLLAGELLQLKELRFRINNTCVANRDEDWLPLIRPSSVQGQSRKREEDACCVCRVPCRRTLDTFDADIIVDASASIETLYQICQGEGDLVLYRKAGADLSDPSEVFVVTDVVKPFSVSPARCTFELSKINLRGATAAALGQQMVTGVWNFDARAGTEGPAVATDGMARRGEQSYDSRMASRTCFGRCCHQDLCPHGIGVTSRRS